MLMLSECYKINKEKGKTGRKVKEKRAGFVPAGEQISSLTNKCKPVRYVLEGSNTQDSPPEARKQVDQRRHAITRNLEPYGFLKSVRKNSIRHMLRQRLHSIILKN